jgi:lipid-binding SYLF domain-containing protein
MMNIKQRKSVYQLAAGLVLSGLLSGAHAETAAELHRDAKEALQLLYSTNKVASDFGEIAKAILVFPNIVKAGLALFDAEGKPAVLPALDDMQIPDRSSAAVIMKPDGNFLVVY